MQSGSMSRFHIYHLTSVLRVLVVLKTDIKKVAKALEKLARLLEKLMKENV